MGKKQRIAFDKKLRGWLDSGTYTEDKHFTRKINRLLQRTTIRRMDYLEINIREVTSRIKMAQKGKLLKSLYQTWLDSERTVARLTNTAFTMSGDDFIFKRIGAKYQGSNLLSRLYNQATTMAEQFRYAVSKATASGASLKGLKQVTKYFLSNGDFRARRILITESTRINSEAKLEGYKKGKVKWYQYIAVMDSRVTDICRRHDLKVYKTEKAQIGKNMPPLHVNCRSSTKPYFVDDRTGRGSSTPPPKPPSKPIKPEKKVVLPKPITKPKPKPKPKETYGFTSTFGHDKKWDKHLRGITAQAMGVVAMLPKPLSLKTGSGAYSQYRRSIESPLSSRRTFWHEYGHFIDNVLDSHGRGEFISYERLTEASKKDSLLIFGVDVSKVGREVTDARARVMRDFKRDNYVRTKTYFKSGRRKGMQKGVTNVPNSDSVQGWSDILDSMTTGYFHKNYMHGHGSKYYNRDKFNKQTENFANLFADYVNGGDQWSETAKMFPNLAKEFELIMDDITKYNLIEGKGV
ncbi:MAG: minor capsid protein [Caldisericia bacterium]|nr:minor capsid protein [Caldisericia bacterium]